MIRVRIFLNNYPAYSILLLDPPLHHTVVAGTRTLHRDCTSSMWHYHTARCFKYRWQTFFYNHV